MLTAILTWLRSPPDDGWRFYEVPFWRRSPVPGQRIIMRRYVDRRWQYRGMTDEESVELASVLVW